jgi:hypothetical protein
MTKELKGSVEVGLKELAKVEMMELLQWVEVSKEVLEEELREVEMRELEAMGKYELKKVMEVELEKLTEVTEK